MTQEITLQEAADEINRLNRKLLDADRSYAKQVALTARFVFEKEKYRNALEFIVSLEPGSRGAYSKFAEAQCRACEALKPSTDAKGASNGNN